MVRLTPVDQRSSETNQEREADDRSQMISWGMGEPTPLLTAYPAYGFLITKR